MLICTDLMMRAISEVVVYSLTPSSHVLSHVDSVPTLAYPTFRLKESCCKYLVRVMAIMYAQDCSGQCRNNSSASLATIKRIRSRGMLIASFRGVIHPALACN
jgi:hypothetical protein